MRPGDLPRPHAIHLREGAAPWLLACLDGLLEGRAGAEARNLAARNRDALPGLRVDALSRTPLCNVKLAEAGEVDVFARDERVLDLAEHGLQATVADGRFAKPLDGKLISALAADHELLVSVEENVLPGGFGSGVIEHLEDSAGTEAPRRARVLRIGLPDRYVTHGKPAALRGEVGLTGEAVAERVLEALGVQATAA